MYYICKLIDSISTYVPSIGTYVIYDKVQRVASSYPLQRKAVIPKHSQTTMLMISKFRSGNAIMNAVGLKPSGASSIFPAHLGPPTVSYCSTPDRPQ